MIIELHSENGEVEKLILDEEMDAQILTLLKIRLELDDSATLEDIDPSEICALIEEAIDLAVKESSK